MTAVIILPPSSPEPVFPPVSSASPEGLLAVGGELTVAWLVAAYRSGIFPWYSDDQPILWWSPDPRVVLHVDDMRITRSLRKTIRRGHLRVSFDTAFEQVIEACATTRRNGEDSGTWITRDMFDAYVRLHEAGFAHSVETWCDDELVGGLYGVACGSMFFGESMFATVSDASKVALAHLACQLRRWGFELIDCQLPSDHVFRLGAGEMSRRHFIDELNRALMDADRPGPWTIDADCVDELAHPRA